MTPHHLILLVVLISCSAIPLGSKDYNDWPPGLYNRNVVMFFFKQNVSIICQGNNEVEWIIDTTDQANNSVQVVTPNEKILRMGNVTGNDTGAYTCIYKNNPNVFWKFYVHVFGDLPGTQIFGYLEPTYKYEGYISLENPYSEFQVSPKPRASSEEILELHKIKPKTLRG
ncbi:uncharacterized protein LOC135836932 [Planococcus citri]|uniref:uncharacterized protein LOC135836932 n=1 Tax=Planococcus citri TaxID=170843 RepID=UPI0031F8FCE8